MNSIYYTHLTLIGLGLIGILLHNLVKLNDLKKANDQGDVNYKLYFKKESISILISVIFVMGLTWTSQEIKELANAGKYLGLSFFFAGYFGQSILLRAVAWAQKILDQKLPPQDNTKTPN